MLIHSRLTGVTSIVQGISMSQNTSTLGNNILNINSSDISAIATGGSANMAFGVNALTVGAGTNIVGVNNSIINAGASPVGNPNVLAIVLQDSFPALGRNQLSIVNSQVLANGLSAWSVSVNGILFNGASGNMTEPSMTDKIGNQSERNA